MADAGGSWKCFRFEVNPKLEVGKPSRSRVCWTVSIELCYTESRYDDCT